MELTKQHFMKIYGQYLEPNTDINQKNVVFKCPFHSDHNPSYAVSTDPNNPVGHCFSCSEKNSWIGFYQKTRNVDYKTALKELDMFDENYAKQKQANYVIIPKQKKQTVKVDYSEYCYNAWANTIMHDKYYEFYGRKLYELRGITYPTAVACMIGYDPEKGWIFPFNRFDDNKCTGYEIRQKEFKKFDFNDSKCYKAKNSESCLSVVWQGTSRKAVCCEGFCDSFFMYQYLHERNQRKNKSPIGYVEETIITPTNGVKTIPELVKENELWNKFDEVLFCLDNDEASRPITEELKQLTRKHRDNFKFFTGLKEGQDFEDWYKERINDNKAEKN